GDGGVGARDPARGGEATDPRHLRLDHRVLARHLAPRLLAGHAARDRALPQGRRARALGDHAAADRAGRRVRLRAVREGAGGAVPRGPALRLARAGWNVIAARRFIPRRSVKDRTGAPLVSPRAPRGFSRAILESRALPLAVVE